MDPNPERDMSLIGHLTELRSRLMICIAALVLCVVLAFFIADPVLLVLTRPIKSMEREPGRDRALELHLAPDGRLWAQNPGNLDSVSTRHFVLIIDDDPATTRTEAARHIIGEPPTQKFYYQSPLDPVMIKLKVAFVLGLLFALPVILWLLGWRWWGWRRRRLVIFKIGLFYFYNSNKLCKKYSSFSYSYQLRKSLGHKPSKKSLLKPPRAISN